MTTSDTYSAPPTDPSLWELRRVFGPAGGPDEVVLTDEGDARAFSVGSGVRRGPPAEALLELWLHNGEGYLLVRAEGARMRSTDLGRFDQIAWGHLKERWLVVGFQDDAGDGVRLTPAGQAAASSGIHEQGRLLERCRRAAGLTQ